MNTQERKFKCTGCGETRPCYVETNQEVSNFSSLLIEDLVCILDATNQTSFNWVEIQVTQK
jgi:hypothetical protein